MLVGIGAIRSRHFCNLSEQAVHRRADESSRWSQTRMPAKKASKGTKGKPPKAVKEPQEWVVEAIRDVKMEGRVKKYLVKWENWPEESNTWEPVGNLDGCMELVKAFEKGHRPVVLEHDQDEEVAVSPVSSPQKSTPAKKKKAGAATPKKKVTSPVKKATPSPRKTSSKITTPVSARKPKTPQPVRASPASKKKPVGKALSSEWELEKIIEDKVDDDVSLSLFLVLSER
jgi:hypothetical protein